MRRTMTLCYILLLGLCGCDNDDGGGSGSGSTLGQGTVTSPWDAHCIATFTADYPVLDVFEDPLFTARAGTAYLLKSHGERFGEIQTEMYYLSSNGPLDFTVKPLDDGTLAFTSNCDLESPQTLNGVFRDLTVYVDEARTEEACILRAGTVFDGPITRRLIQNEGTSLMDISGEYAIEAPGLAEFCDNYEIVYVQIESRFILGGHHTFVPILPFMTQTTESP